MDTPETPRRDVNWRRRYFVGAAAVAAVAARLGIIGSATAQTTTRPPGRTGVDGRGATPQESVTRSRIARCT